MSLQIQEVLVIYIQITPMAAPFLWSLDVVITIGIRLYKLVWIRGSNLTVLLRDSDLFWIEYDMLFSLFLLATVSLIAGTCFSNILHILPSLLL